MLRRRPSTLDHETALRLVAGAVQPDDAPPGYSRVALLLSEAASTPPPVPAPRAAATVAAMVEAVRTSSPGKVPRFSRRGASGRSISTKVAVVAGTLVLTAGGAAAATGSLPPSLQDATARVASYVGLNLPFPGGTDAGDGDDNSSTGPANPFAPATPSVRTQPSTPSQPAPTMARTPVPAPARARRWSPTVASPTGLRATRPGPATAGPTPTMPTPRPSSRGIPASPRTPERPSLPPRWSPRILSRSSPPTRRNPGTRPSPTTRPSRSRGAGPAAPSARQPRIPSQRF